MTSGGWDNLSGKRSVRRNLRRPADDGSDAAIESKPQKINFDVIVAGDDAVEPSESARQAGLVP
jgi:hypothetical protein